MKLILPVMLLLAGCMTTNPEAWSRTPSDALRRDLYECRMEADARARDQARFGGAIIPLIALFQRRSDFHECMEARGWKRSDQERAQ